MQQTVVLRQSWFSNTLLDWERSIAHGKTTKWDLELETAATTGLEMTGCTISLRTTTTSCALNCSRIQHSTGTEQSIMRLVWAMRLHGTGFRSEDTREMQATHFTFTMAGNSRPTIATMINTAVTVLLPTAAASGFITAHWPAWTE